MIMSELFSKVENFVNLIAIRITLAIYDFKDDQKGDTNFISILILLAIGLALAAVFIGFRDRIMDWVDNTIPDMWK